MRAFHCAVCADADDACLPAQRAERWNGRNFVTALCKPCQHIRARVLLDLQAVAAVGEGLAQQKAWACERGSRIKPVVQQEAQDQRQRLRLSVGTLCSINQMRPPVFQRQTGIERIERPLARRIAVRATRISAKGGSAVLPENACVAGDNTAPPVEIDALKQ